MNYFALSEIYLLEVFFGMRKRILLIFTALIASTALFMSLKIFGTGYENIFPKCDEKAGIIDFSFTPPTVAARSAIVIDAESGNVIFSHNADESRGMASTTKIMTALVAIENGDIGEEFVIPKEAVGIEGSSVYLKEGERLTLEELLYCLLLESGNDAATAIALLVGGSVESFVGMMNTKAEELGLEITHFDNPHGLSSESHKTTARELALITASAMKQPLFRKIVSQKTAFVRYDGRENGRRLVNHNKLLFGYSGAIGVKTGYTMLDGKCLVSAAERNGITLIAVTLQDPFPTSTHRKMLDGGFDLLEKKSISNGIISQNIPLENGFCEYITAKSEKEIFLSLPKGAIPDCELILPQTLSAPIKKGEYLGYAKFTLDGEIVYIINLYADESAEERKKSLFEILFGE